MIAKNVGAQREQEKGDRQDCINKTSYRIRKKFHARTMGPEKKSVNIHKSRPESGSMQGIMLRRTVSASGLRAGCRDRRKSRGFFQGMGHGVIGVVGESISSNKLESRDSPEKRNLSGQWARPDVIWEDVESV
jgi:hypothetical protein